MEEALVKETAQWRAHYKVEKYREDIAPYERPNFRSNPFKWLWRWFFTRGRWERLFHELYQPYEVLEGEGNLLLNEGINAMWTLVCGGTETAYNNTNAQIGVGNGTAAASATQTDLQGASTQWKGMESGYPTYGSSQQAVFKSSYGSTEANFAWEEWSVRNGATANKNLNRKVESLGTKTTGTWTLEVSITLS